MDITSTRMLMAHGFLKRIFEVFEQHRTSVDVVTTSEVSVSVTMDDARRLPEIMAALAEVADVTREDRMAIICAVGEGLQSDPTFVSHLLEAVGGVPIRMVSQAAARRNITLVINEADLEPALVRVHARFFRRATRDEGIETIKRQSPNRSIDSIDMRVSMRILLIGHGRMGKLVESLAPAHGCEIAGIVTSRSGANAIAGGSPAAADVADRLLAARRGAARTSSRLRGRGLNAVIGTTGWQADEAGGARAGRPGRHRRLRVGELLDRHARSSGAVVEEAARLFGAQADAGAWIHEAHHAQKKDAPSGTALMLKSAMERAGYARPIDVAVHARGRRSRHAHRRVRLGGRNRDADAHGARSRRVRARRARGAKWLKGRRGWFTVRDMIGQ